MKSQKVSFTLGNVRLTLGIGDENANGIVDVSLVVRILGLFELPPVVIDLDGKLAAQAVDAFKSLGDIFSKKK
jgi:hypothetical protein